MAPKKAPYGFPIPPRMTAENRGIRNFHPIIGKSWAWKTASKTPATAANPAPITHVHRITISVLIPVTLARSTLSAVARIALPILVFVRSRCSEIVTPSATPAINNASGGIRTSIGSLKKSLDNLGYCWISPPQVICTRPRRAIATPREAIAITTVLEPRFLRRRYTPISSSTAAKAAIKTANGRAINRG